MTGSIPPFRTITANESLAFKTGQLFMPAAFINDTETSIRALEKLIREYDIGGLCFFHSPASAATNFEGPREIPHNPDSLGSLKSLIARYQKAARYPLLIAIDAEWGLSMRVENGEAYPYALTLGALEPGHPLVYQTGLRMAADCREAGIHWNLAPVADVNSNPENPVIGYRSFGAEARAVGLHARAFYQGLRDGGLLGCAKHFPGHGDTDVDSHLELPVLKTSRNTLEKNELLPFQYLVESGVDAVMTGHLSVPALDPSGLPASLSGRMIREVLRDKMGFQGAVITDALNMRAVQRKFPEKGALAFHALLAGNDMLCFAEDIPEAIGKICREAPEATVEAAFRRVWALKEKVFAPAAPKGEPGLNTPTAPGTRSTPKHTPPELRKALAASCLSLYPEPDQPDPETAAKSAVLPNPFTLLLAGNGMDSFKAGMERAYGPAVSHWDLEANEKAPFALPKNQAVLLAFCPPSLKPAGHFGLSQVALKALQELFSQREVYLCHFGNPYALGLLPLNTAKQVLVAYQDLEAFQQQAVLFYCGKAGAPGRLPVTIKPIAQ